MFKANNNGGISLKEAVKSVERNPAWESRTDLDYVGMVTIKSSFKLNLIEEIHLLGFFAAHIYNMCEDIKTVELKMSEELFEYEKIVIIEKRSNNEYTILLI